MTIYLSINIYSNFLVRMRIRLQLLANQNWRSNGCYQSLACAPGSGYENDNFLEYFADWKKQSTKEKVSPHTRRHGCSYKPRHTKICKYQFTVRLITPSFCCRMECHMSSQNDTCKTALRNTLAIKDNVSNKIRQP